MKPNSKLLRNLVNGNYMSGGMLLEVVLAIAIFAFGMLALVQLQGNVTRSSSDANTRTVATNIAEELVEQIRGYEQVPAIADNGKWEYMELAGTALNGTVQRGGMDYAVTATIKDFWRDEANDTFISNDATNPPTVPAGLSEAYASFKLLQIDVSWNTGQDFYVDDENTAVLGDNTITVYEIIPNSPPILGAKIAANLNEPAGTPTVNYTPGLNPDIVALTLDNQKLKEATTPIPDVIRDGELTETYFEVVSYNTANAFTRREEFLTVGCECILNPANGGSEFGLRPTVWNGVEYTEGDPVTDKNVGVSANNQQSPFCSVCCRDHHDGGSGENDGSFEDERLVYDPWNYSPSDKGTDHAHYSKSNKGVISVAEDGDTYLEACRLVRKDGFFRVAQDFNQRGFFGVIEDYMDNVAEVAEYSDYVTTAAEDFYENGQSDLPLPGDTGMPQFTSPVDGLKYDYLPSSQSDVTMSGPYTSLPTPLNVQDQQLRSRGIYLDFMTEEVEDKIATCLPLDADGNPPTGCQIPQFTSPLEIYPFFEVQLTKLANWIEDPVYEPVDVTNEPVASNNTHSRGRAILKKTGMGATKTDFGIHRGNVGIAATDPIRINDPQAALTETDYLHIDTVDSGVPTVAGVTITGGIRSGVGGVRAADVALSFNEAMCGKTPTGYKCIVPNVAVDPTLTISNYYKKNQNLYACSDQLVELNNVFGTNSSTTFTLSGSISSPADIVIQDTACAALP